MPPRGDARDGGGPASAPRRAGEPSGAEPPPAVANRRRMVGASWQARSAARAGAAAWARGGLGKGARQGREPRMRGRRLRMRPQGSPRPRRPRSQGQRAQGLRAQGSRLPQRLPALEPPRKPRPARERQRAAGARERSAAPGSSRRQVCETLPAMTAGAAGSSLVAPARFTAGSTSASEASATPEATRVAEATALAAPGALALTAGRAACAVARWMRSESAEVRRCSNSARRWGSCSVHSRRRLSSRAWAKKSMASSAMPRIAAKATMAPTLVKEFERESASSRAVMNSVSVRGAQAHWRHRGAARHPRTLLGAVRRGRARWSAAPGARPKARIPWRRVRRRRLRARAG